MKSTMTAIVVGLCVFAAVPSWADFYAGTADFTRTTGYYDNTSGRGEDTLYNTSLNTSGYVAGVTSLAAGSFQTFCVERHEYTSPTMDVWVSTTFIDETTGLVTGDGSHAILGSEPFGDNLEAETAYLYTLFATGNLPGYDYTPGAGRGLSAKSLQLAIWSIEEVMLPLTDPTAIAWKAAAEAAVDSGAWTGLGSVRVLNMYVNGECAQDMLYHVPVPGAVLLGLLGLTAAGWKLRRFA